MKSRYILLVLFMAFFMPGKLDAQGLLDMLEEDAEEPQQDFTTNTFLTTRIINGQSVENPFPGDLIFIISHHFGRLNQGAYDFWGLDQATIRLGFEYGINDRMAVSIGRSSYEKTYDGFVKYKLLRQQSGIKNIPVTVSWFSGAYIRSQRWAFSDRDYTFTHRVSYAHQLLIARKFSRNLSIQLTPAWVHRNLVEFRDDPNDFFVLGAGGRMALTNWVTLNAEYFYRLNTQYSEDFFNTFSVGFDFDTGGHVFQLHFTNAQPMFEPGFLTETRGNWLEGDIYFGFNIKRVFTLR
ncbi:MAG: hypothetical protein EA393_04145 [Bacteroidetes bacterium]|nr:MAG: hypothetical protein EA393_04145 [Bacteroidota bacterium]